MRVPIEDVLSGKRTASEIRDDRQDKASERKNYLIYFLFSQPDFWVSAILFVSRAHWVVLPHLSTPSKTIKAPRLVNALG